MNKYNDKNRFLPLLVTLLILLAGCSTQVDSRRGRSEIPNYTATLVPNQTRTPIIFGDPIQYGRAGQITFSYWRNPWKLPFNGSWIADKNGGVNIFMSPIWNGKTNDPRPILMDMYFSAIQVGSFTLGYYVYDNSSKLSECLFYDPCVMITQYIEDRHMDMQVETALCKEILSGTATVERVTPLKVTFNFICRTETGKDTNVSGRFDSW